MEEDRLGFFSGMLFGMLLPLVIMGGAEFNAKEKPTESFYGGIIFGIFTDIALVVGLIFLFKK
jgi:hypothetical protein